MTRYRLVDPEFALCVPSFLFIYCTVNIKSYKFMKFNSKMRKKGSRREGMGGGERGREGDYDFSKNSKTKVIKLKDTDVYGLNFILKALSHLHQLCVSKNSTVSL